MNKKTKATFNTPKQGLYAIEGFRIQAIILIIIGFIFYSNSFFNEYALDDGIVIEKNEYVQKGIKGIPKILTSDAYESFYKQMNAKQQLSGGRYRPLSIVTFAIEQQFFGKKEKEKTPTDIATIRHILNVLFYIISIVVLLFFLRNYLLKDKPIAAFATCLFFLIHPLHTEVIANVKSRDEILSFLFITLTFIAAFRYREKKEKHQLFYAILFYFLALLSKEYAITLLILLPMLFYIVYEDSFKKSILETLPYLSVAACYLYIRFKIVGSGATEPNPDVLNNPYLFATKPEAWATKIEMLNHYLRLLFFPHPLSSDYSYSTIPYTNFKAVKVWLSIFIHLSMIVATIVLFFKRNILAFALAFYLLHLALVSNLIMDIGATMGERLVYHSSFGLALILGVLADRLLKKVKEKKTKMIMGVGLASVLVVLSAMKTIPRNSEWKNDATLFITDVNTVPNSALVNGNAGKSYIDLSEKPENKEREAELLSKAIYYLLKSNEIHKDYVNGYLNTGVAYYKLKDYDKAAYYWNMAKERFPNNPYITRSYKILAAAYYNEGMKIWSKNPQKAIEFLDKAVVYAPQNADYWYNIGGASYTNGNFEKAKQAWIKTLQLNPQHQQAQQGMQALEIKAASKTNMKK